MQKNVTSSCLPIDFSRSVISDMRDGVYSSSALAKADDVRDVNAIFIFVLNGLVMTGWKHNIMSTSRFLLTRKFTFLVKGKGPYFPIIGDDIYKETLNLSFYY